MFLNKIYFQLFTICVLALSEAPAVFSSKDARIIGGEPTTIDRAPYIVQLIYNGKNFGGGTLVSIRHIVTAAHCVVGKSILDMTVLAGTDQVYGAGAWSRVAKIMVPQGFSWKTMHTDVAVLKLKSTLVGPNIRPIGLCSKYSHDGAAATVSGWGLTSQDPSSSAYQLHTVNVSTISLDVCVHMYRGKTELTGTMFCAAGPKGKDSCDGDSGGPAIIDNELCGIVSWGVGCGQQSYPGVYTNVTSVKPFIIKAMDL